MLDRTALGFVLYCALAASLALTARATAQTITVPNGGTITVENGGVWDLQGATVDLGGTGSTAQIDETGGGRFTGGTLTATRDLNSPSQANPAHLGIEISSGQNLGATTVTRGHAVQTAPNGNESIARYYDVAPTNNSGLSATLTFHYDDDELNGLAESNLELFRSTDGGSTWTERGQDGRDANANTVTLSGVDQLSRWTLGSEHSPLPVELTTFDARADGETVQLAWTTASETNNAGFHVQRTRSGADGWTQVGFVEGYGTTSEPKTYSFDDVGVPYEADSLRYRLKQVDLDGAAHYSESVEVALASPAELALRGNYPNPFAGQTTIRYEVPQSGDIRLAVYNVLGQRVALLVHEQQEAGRKEISFTARDLPSGVYFVRLTSGGMTRTQKITVVQ
jgi:hypothetical protein